jgi:protein-S-isoprenylcysteine O-methyltransferase Ste14
MAMSDDPGPRRDRPSGFPWPPVLLIGIIVAAFVLDRLAPLGWPGVDDLPARIVGLAIGGLGVALLAWAAWTLHHAGTTVMPHKGSAALVTSGPFARFRNPIYIADTMVLLGLGELTKNIWLVGGAMIFVALVTWLAILPEERHLEARFGDAYRAYKARSRRWL